MQSGRRLRAALLGAGSLGRAFIRRLRDEGGPIDLVAVVTGHHGRQVSRDRIDPSMAVNLVEAGELGVEGPEDLAEILAESQADVLVECIPQNIRTGEPALGFHRVALDAGVHVVTANKAPVVIGFRDAQHRAAKAGVGYRFGATVLDGLPVFDFVSQLRGQRVVRLRGVLNATSSVVLDSLAEGGSRSRGLARAQARGIAEADPVLDLDGWDAATKAALLGNVWMEGSLRVVDVQRSGLEGLKDAAVARAAEQGLRYRLIAQVHREAAGLAASVEPVALEPDDAFHGLPGARGGIEIETDGGLSFVLLQRSAGLADAAAGLLADCRALLEA